LPQTLAASRRVAYFGVASKTPISSLAARAMYKPEA